MKLIAYGSLMSTPSLESTLNRKAKLRLIRMPGWRRVFDAPFGEYAFLNIKRDPACIIEAAYFEISKRELLLFGGREAGSELIEVIPGFMAFIWPEEYCRTLPALRSYFALCEQAATELGIDFSIGLEFPPNMVEDLANPLYP